MTKDKAKELLNKIEDDFEDGFLDFYIDFLRQTVEACNKGLTGILSKLSHTDPKELMKLQEEADRMQQIQIDALSLIYDVYCDLKLSLNGSLLDKDESPSRDEHRDLHQLYKDA